eukprot:TRINITY_DN9149_c0_g1_i1.p1 TRINITY_DN9149_c0_g1~~TRINITY_DN9149_c0_g1_i1.p1  ORF type:complete len:283 (-),score=38.96 TRINITY_DN9149_c0_g1_i1:321-1169(-)
MIIKREFLILQDVIVVKQTEMSSLLSQSHRCSQKGLALLNGDEHRQKPWIFMAEALKESKIPFDFVFGTDYYTHMANNSKHSQLLNNGMKASGSEPELCEIIDLVSTVKICDCGGGAGGLARSLLKRFPNLHACVFDLPHVLEGVAVGQTELDDKGNRLQFKGGSFFKWEELPNDCDAFIFKRVIHDWDDESAVQILSNVCKVLAPEGKLFVADRVVEGEDEYDPSTVDMLGAWMDVNTMTILRGEERTRERWRTILSKSGFTLIDVSETGRFHLLVAVKHI